MGGSPLLSLPGQQPREGPPHQGAEPTGLGRRLGWGARREGPRPHSLSMPWKGRSPVPLCSSTSSSKVKVNRSSPALTSCILHLPLGPLQVAQAPAAGPYIAHLRPLKGQALVPSITLMTHSLSSPSTAGQEGGPAVSASHPLQVQAPPHTHTPPTERRGRSLLAPQHARSRCRRNQSCVHTFEVKTQLQVSCEESQKPAPARRPPMLGFTGAQEPDGVGAGRGVRREGGPCLPPSLPSGPAHAAPGTPDLPPRA